MIKNYGHTGGINHVIYNSTIKNNDSIDYYYFKKRFLYESIS